MRKLEDPFNLNPSVVGLTIVKELVGIRRGIKVVSNSLIFSFNLAFLVSKGKTVVPEFVF
jgi:hypothetical protein